jgi:hypothetical protein
MCFSKLIFMCDIISEQQKTHEKNVYNRAFDELFLIKIVL